MTVIRASSILFLALLAGGVDRAQAVSPPPVQAEKGMVVTGQHLASAVGGDILREGGNAVDAAVAVGYALAVVLPCCGNIGGGGFATLHLASGKDVFMNFRETAPGAATETMYLDTAGDVVPDLSLRGYKAVAVPGIVLGLETMLRDYGTMPRYRVMAPAIRLAEEGYVLGNADVTSLDAAAKNFAGEPNVAAIFLHDGRPWQAGERLVQKDLAATLKAIAEHGPDAFYRGPIAKAVVAASEANGGILTEPDFAAYTVTQTAPVRCSYRDHDFISAPPPSSGGTTLCEILNILEGYPMAELGFHSAAADSLHRSRRCATLMSTATLRLAIRPLSTIRSIVSCPRDHAAAIRAQIPPTGPGARWLSSQVSRPTRERRRPPIRSSTSSATRWSVTYTINGFFGAGVIAGDTGFFLNNEMDDFTIKPGAPNMFGLVQGKKNAIAPGKRPLSSMSPTIVMKDGQTFMVIGSPGGPRIITSMVATVMNVIDYGMDLQEAVDAPRIHHQWLPDEVFVEPMALSPDTRRMLVEMGYKITEQAPWGAAAAILVMPKDVPGAARGSGSGVAASSRMKPGMLYGANDNRRPAGAAVGH